MFHNPAARIGAALAATLVVLLVVLAIARPDMMSMAMVRNLFVGFGL